MYGKIINGQLSYSLDTIIFDNGGCICNPNLEQLQNLGYKTISNSEIPITGENEHIIETYIENDNEIIINYEVVENIT